MKASGLFFGVSPSSSFRTRFSFPSLLNNDTRLTPCVSIITENSIHSLLAQEMMLTFTYSTWGTVKKSNRNSGTWTFTQRELLLNVSWAWPKCRREASWDCRRRPYKGSVLAETVKSKLGWLSSEIVSQRPGNLLGLSGKETWASWLWWVSARAGEKPFVGSPGGRWPASRSLVTGQGIVCWVIAAQLSHSLSIAWSYCLLNRGNGTWENETRVKNENTIQLESIINIHATHFPRLSLLDTSPVGNLWNSPKTPISRCNKTSYHTLVWFNR